MSKQAAPRRKRAERETRAVYAKPAPRKTRAKKLVMEMYGGEPYEYYPLGKYVVAAPGVCGGRPTFKYTRIEAKYALDLIATGRSIEEIAYRFRRSNVSADAVREALSLAALAFANHSSVPTLAA
jgi:uncharacterized protein (DUF433 family)